MAKDEQRTILEYLSGRREEMVNTLAELVNMDSPSTDKACMDAFSFRLAQMWKETGAQVTSIPQETTGNHLRVDWGNGDEQILVLCHMDTVWSRGETSKRPFKVEGGKAYGPGAYDMKSGIVQAMFAVKALDALNLKPTKKIVILHNSDEEIGSPSSRQLIEGEAKKSLAVLVLEPAAQGGALKTWRKGVGMFRITIKGKASHAGADYEKGASAVLESAHVITYLHGLTDLEEGTTVNVGTIRAGTRSNVVADHALLEVDLRVKTPEAASRVVPKILGLRPVDPRVSITVEGGLNRPPMERNSKNLGLYQIAKSIGESIGIELVESGTGGGSDGNFTSALGIPTLDGLGPVGDNAHSVDEYLLVGSLPERASIVAGLFLNV
ncbi:MAG: M20 family metallopeptidase [Bacillota bacterium]|jgi:glutamate carboxypeptidase